MSSKLPPAPASMPSEDVQAVIDQLPQSREGGLDGLDVKTSDGHSEQLVDAIEMIGEEQVSGLGPQVPVQVTAGMRYLHSSRTIHQLVTDRNRAVGIYLAVASLLITASSALLNANPRGELMVPIGTIQTWCFPLTFATLTVLALFVAFLLIRTRAGLIYEVAKMNALLGLPVGRVRRVSPLSIHFLMHALISLAGGASATLCSIFLIPYGMPEAEDPTGSAILIGAGVAVGLLVLYVVTVQYITSDRRLQQLDGK